MATTIRLATLAALLFAAHQSHADTITLREQVFVKGPRVTLGDLATIEGEDAAYLKTIEIGPAASPGSARRLNAALVRSRLIEGGFSDEQFDIRGSRHVLATTRHLEITRGTIAEALREFVRREMPWEIESAIVEVAPPASEYRVSDGVVDLRWRANPEYDYLGTGTFRGEIVVDGRVEKTFYAKATVTAYERVVVATQAIGRGDPITSANAGLKNRELSMLKGEPFFSFDEVLGQVAKSSIYAGQVITPRKVAPPILVKRNQLVIVETTMGALSIRGQARALSQGAAGDLVRAVNLRSKQEFVGVLRADGVIVVD